MCEDCNKERKIMKVSGYLERSLGKKVATYQMETMTHKLMSNLQWETFLEILDELHPDGIVVVQEKKT